MTIESDIKQKALELGFDAVGITTAAPLAPEMADFYRTWLADGRAAEMGYLHRNNDKRFAPAELLAGARSIICVALNYRPAKTEQTESPNLRIARIARFAQYEDYHPFIKTRLFQLAEFIKTKTKAWSGSDTMRPPSAIRLPQGDAIPALPLRASVIQFKACVDSAPLAERALACRAGLGFIGKNHMLIHPELGGQILLGELLTTLQLTPDAPLDQQSCGGCNRCLRACPTGALAPDGSFDARKCISYLTIEEPDETKARSASAGDAKVPDCLIRGDNPNLKNYIFGCDECLLACPHELAAPPRRNRDFQHHPEWQALTAQQIHDMTEAEFQTTFVNSGFLRLGLPRLKRNCRV
jgi:epoxyqueuosine reductase